MVDDALFALSPQVAFEAQQAHQKAAAEAAAKAWGTADQRAWEMGLEIERTARGIHARMMSPCEKERDAVALTGGKAPPMRAMEDARFEARGEIASYSAGTPYLAYIE